VQFEKREIHPVFHRFPNFHLVQNLSLSTLADLIIGYLSRSSPASAGLLFFMVKNAKRCEKNQFTNGNSYSILK
jgi:hypothetical protein